MKREYLAATLAALLLLAGCGAAPAEKSVSEELYLAAKEAEADPDMPDPSAPVAVYAPYEAPLAVGTYVYTDGSYITVEEDGSLEYVPYAYGTVAGIPVSGQVFFEGFVTSTGVVELEKAFYRGVDLTRRGARNGGEIEEMWFSYAQSMYIGLQYYGSVNLMSVWNDMP